MPHHLAPIIQQLASEIRVLSHFGNHHYPQAVAAKNRRVEKKFFKFLGKPPADAVLHTTLLTKPCCCRCYVYP
jgi:hypothetical protein